MSIAEVEYPEAAAIAGESEAHDAAVNRSDANVVQPAAAAARRYTDTIISSVALMLAMMVLQRVIGFVRGVLFCRWLEPDQLGQWDVALSFLMLAAPVAVLGLPGSFGRYLEHYRQVGLLRVFLARTTFVTVLLGCSAVAAMFVATGAFSRLIYGKPDQPELVVWTALGLATLIVHNYLVSLFIAARMYRVVSVLQFLQGVVFTVVGLVLLIAWRTDSVSVIASFAFASLVSAIVCLPWLRHLRSETNISSERPAHSAFWAKLMPFAIWIWLTNLLSGLFEMIDRYMIVHCAGLSENEAMSLVGNYHSSRLVPMLFVSIAALLSSMITPHLSHDWEAGQRAAVSQRLNYTLKLFAIALLLGSTAILVLSPFLFGVLLEGKFDGGLAVLPWTLAYCVWFSLACVAQNYLWCAEKAGLSSLAILVALVASVMLNLVLLPRYGLLGAVWATSAANIVALALIYNFSQRHGMNVDRGTWALSIAPFALALPIWPAVGVCLVVTVLALATDWFFTAEEKSQLLSICRRALERIPGVGTKSESVHTTA